MSDRSQNKTRDATHLMSKWESNSEDDTIAYGAMAAGTAKFSRQAQELAKRNFEWSS
jgi:hypothetical protein